MDLHWTNSLMGEMSAPDLFKILKLRSEVFVVEQNCVYLDLDDKDEQCIHLAGWVNGEVAVYARVIAPNISYPHAASIGRVCNAMPYRRRGLGKLLMQKAIELCKKSFGEDCAIKIGAQYYLLDFYQKLGFKQVSEIYLEDGIEHISMLRNSGSYTIS